MAGSAGNSSGRSCSRRRSHHSSSGTDNETLTPLVRRVQKHVMCNRSI